MGDEDDLYDCVYGEDEGGEVYEDLMKAEEAHQPVGLPLIFKVTLSIVLGTGLFESLIYVTSAGMVFCLPFQPFLVNVVLTL